MGKVIKVKDRTYRIRFYNTFYYLEEQKGRWYNKTWQEIYKSTNKTLFIKKLNTYLV